VKAFLALIPAAALLIACAFIWRHEKTGPSLIQLLGAFGVTIVVLTHVAEASRVVTWMRWGEPDSPGHYLDLTSAITGLILLPVGYGLRRHLRGNT